MYADALALSRDIGNQLFAAHVLVGLGYVAVHQGDAEQATTFFVESLEIYRERASQIGIAYCLAGYAELRRVQGRVAQAVRLLASDALLPASRGVRVPVHRIEYERSVAAARVQLDEATFTAAWAAGRALTMEQAIELATLDSAN